MKHRLKIDFSRVRHDAELVVLVAVFLLSVI